MRVLAASLLIVLGAMACGDAPEPTRAPPSPVLVLIEFNKMLMRPGTDAPTFALYDDGRVIYRTKYAPHAAGTAWEKGHSEFATVVLSNAERKALIREALGESLQPLLDLEPEYGDEVRGPWLGVHVWDDAERHSVTIRRYAEDIPETVLGVRKVLRAYKHPDAQPWLPEQLEVMFGDFSNAKDEPVAWPEAWPGLSDPTTKKFRDDDYWVHLDIGELDKLLAYFRGLNTRFGEVCQPIEIDGRLWGASLRFPFPREELWMRK